MDNNKVIFKKLFFKIKFFSNKFLIGNYKSKFKGEGIDFAENRDYIFGDSIRNINWTLWAKFGKPFTKIFEEERGELNIVVLDVSSSMFFKSLEDSKIDIGIKIALIILYISSINNDKFSFLCFSDRIIKFFPFGKGQNHFFLIYNYIMNINYCNSDKTIICDILKHLYKILKKRANIFLISDFVDNNRDLMLENLKILEKKHNIFLFHILDSFEVKNKNEIDKSRSIEGNNAIYNINFEDYFFTLQKMLAQNFRYYVLLTNEDNIYFVLKNFFERR